MLDYWHFPTTQFRGCPPTEPIVKWCRSCIEQYEHQLQHTRPITKQCIRAHTIHKDILLEFGTLANATNPSIYYFGIVQLVCTCCNAANTRISNRQANACFLHRPIKWMDFVEKQKKPSEKNYKLSTMAMTIHRHLSDTISQQTEAEQTLRRRRQPRWRRWKKKTKTISTKHTTLTIISRLLVIHTQWHGIGGLDEHLHFAYFMKKMFDN